MGLFSKLFGLPTEEAQHEAPAPATPSASAASVSESISFRVAGVTMENRQDMIKCMPDHGSNDKDLRFVPENGNEYDENAVQVRYKKDLIGYVPREDAKRVRAFIKAYPRYRVNFEVRSFTPKKGGKKYLVEVNIRKPLAQSKEDKEKAAADALNRQIWEYEHFGYYLPQRATVAIELYDLAKAGKTIAKNGDMGDESSVAIEFSGDKMTVTHKELGKIGTSESKNIERAKELLESMPNCAIRYEGCMITPNIGINPELNPCVKLRLYKQKEQDPRK